MLVSHKDYEIPYDVTMFWEFFRWERFKIGHIYLQRFPNGKLYAGQSIQFAGRMRAYRSGKGANPHHSSAIKHHEWKNVFVLAIVCPLYLLDTIEIFLISYHDLMNAEKGYNKTSGGRKNWTVSKETRAKLSAAGMGRTPTIETRAKLSVRQMGEKNHNFGKIAAMETRAKMSVAQTGENNHFYGKTHTIETRAELSAQKMGANHPMFGKKQSEETCAKRSRSLKGKPKTDEHRANLSGSKHHGSKPICVFGVLYPCGKDASDDLRSKYISKNKDNFINKWLHSQKHQEYTFQVSKDFYAYAVKNELENITRDLYDIWSAFAFDYM